MKFKTYLNESSGLYYHGTSKEKNGKSILKEGYIKPPKLPKKKNFLTPVEGKTYLSKSLEYSVIYTVGANMIGEDLPESILKADGYIGYLFVVKDLINAIQPDEDNIGELIYNNKIPWLTTFAKNNLTDLQYKKVMDGFYAYFAKAGKKLIAKFTTNQLKELIDISPNIAYDGSIKFTEAWKFDKRNCSKLKKDASNFFDIADRVK